MKQPSIVWFRQDLRLEDQPALIAAIQQGDPIIPLYIWAPEEIDNWKIGAASKWWLHYSLINLQEELLKRNLHLVIRQANSSLEALLEVIKETNAQTLFWNRCYEPAAVKRDAHIKSILQQNGIQTQIFNGSLLYDPWSILNKQNKPFQVFTPFWKHCLKTNLPTAPLSISQPIASYNQKIKSDPIKALDLLPHIHWDTGLKASWQPGCHYASIQLKKALNSAIPNYLQDRDYPYLNGTSCLSPYLHYGEISPRIIWQAVKAEKNLDPNQAEGFLRQLGWREFGYYLLYHFPHTPDEPLYDKFRHLPWTEDYSLLSAWQKGLTGYPIIDAGMRQLWKTGWMHNRVRMLVGSFLVKDLFIPWQEGEKWFWDTLVDADLANNTLGWQWVAGCGADAAPYFRIFNPVLQGEKFDPQGDYVKMWVPELKQMPSKWIHKPWEAPLEVLKQAHVILGKDYPQPIVDHSEARLKALANFSKL